MYNKKEKYFCAEKAHIKAKKGVQQMKGREESKENMKNTREKNNKTQKRNNISGTCCYNSCFANTCRSKHKHGTRE